MVLKYCGTYIYKNSKIIIYKVLPFKVKYHVTNFNFQSQKKKKNVIARKSLLLLEKQEENAL